MSALLPPSRLLATTILSTAVVLGIRTVDLVTSAPTMTAFLAGATQAMEVAGTTQVIGRANAAPAEVAKPSFPHASSPASPQPTAPVAAVTPTAPAVDVPPVAATPADPVAGDATQDIKLKRGQIEEREARLTEREAALAAADKHVAERVAELQAIQARLEALEAERKAAEEANWTGLVKLYEGMRPRDAAVIFNGLEKPVLLELLDRMKPAKASLVIALMEPNSARQITTELAAKRTHSTTLTN